MVWWNLAVLPENARVEDVVVMTPQLGSEFESDAPPAVAVKNPVSLIVPVIAASWLVLPRKVMDPVIVS